MELREGPTISIALATYNGEPFLRELLRFQEQTTPPFEILVQDDGSSDQTRPLLENFAEKTSLPVQLHFNPVQLGFAGNFLSAAEKCRGEFVAFADQDDVWSPLKIAAVTRDLRAHPGTTVLVHRLTTVDRALRSLSTTFPVLPSNDNDPDPWMKVPGLAMIVRRSLVTGFDWRARPPSRDLDDLNHQMDHDEWLYFLGYNNETIRFCNTPLVKYRQHGENFSGAPRRRNLVGSIRRALAEDFSSQRYRTQAARSYFEYAVFQAGDAIGTLPLRTR